MKTEVPLRTVIEGLLEHCAGKGVLLVLSNATTVKRSSSARNDLDSSFLSILISR